MWARGGPVLSGEGLAGMENLHVVMMGACQKNHEPACLADCYSDFIAVRIAAFRMMFFYRSESTRS
jgi:hypothetical protein